MKRLGSVIGARVLTKQTMPHRLATKKSTAHQILTSRFPNGLNAISGAQINLHGFATPRSLIPCDNCFPRFLLFRYVYRSLGRFASFFALRLGYSFSRLFV
jgi:hypothetical protein